VPSPLGHALAGIAAGWVIAPPATRREAVGWGTLFAFAAMAPDLDLVAGVAGVHRGPTHSLAAAVAAGALTWFVSAATSRRPIDARREGGGTRQQVRRALAVTAAYATHTLLDWLSADSSAPFGIMALWPLTDNYYESSWHVFLATSRRYWRSDFWTLNLHAVVRELAILGPVAAAVARLRAWKPFTS
jgi:inner membrane protein